MHLELDPPDWNCDCASREDVCEHAAAAVIALRQARRSGERLPGADQPTGRIGVRLARRGGALHFERAVVVGDREELLQSTLAAVTSGRVDGPAFLATAADLAVERALGTRLRGELPRGLWPRAARGARGLQRRHARRRARARERRRRSGSSAGSRTRPRASGCARGATRAWSRRSRARSRCSTTARSARSARRCSRAASSRSSRAGGSTAPTRRPSSRPTVLPSLRERIPLEIATDRLPRTSSEPPRIALSIEREGDALAVLALLVYGDPPTARVDAGRLVPLGGALPLRDEAAERALLRRLAQELELAPGRRVVATGSEALELADRLRALAGASASPALARFARVGSLAPRFDASAGGAAFELTDAAGQHAHARPTARVLDAWRAGESWVALDGGGFAELPADWLARHGARVADLLAARGERGELPTAALPELAALAEELGAPVPEAAAALRRGLAALADARAPAAPRCPPTSPRCCASYQSEGVRWLGGLRELALPALLADDMGLGKTLQALCAVRGRTLVVAPTSVVPNWAAEAARFRPGAARVRLPRPRARARSGRRPHAHELCAAAARRRRALRGRLGDRRARRVAGDQERRQPGRARGAPPARPVPRSRSRARRSRTGSPSSGASSSSCRAAGSAASATSTSAMRGRSPRATPRRPSGCARACGRSCCGASSATSRPSCRRAPRWCCTSSSRDDERQVYDAIRAATREDVAARFAAGGSAFQVLEALLRLRQAACDASLVPGARIERSAKLEVLRENLEEAVAEGHKALVFSQWTSLLDRVEPVLRERGPAVRAPRRLDARPRRGGRRSSRARAARRCCSSRCARAAPGSTSPRPTACSSSIPGGIPPSRSRPPTARTGSARRAR